MYHIILSTSVFQYLVSCRFSHLPSYYSVKANSYFLYLTKMADIPAKLAKPQMRRLLQSQIRTNLIVGICLGVVGGIAAKYLICEPRKKRYADFYRNYDPEAAFYDMVKSGADFQSLNV